MQNSFGADVRVLKGNWTKKYEEVLSVSGPVTGVNKTIAMFAKSGYELSDYSSYYPYYAKCKLLLKK